jgi:uncharacterized membrane protein
MFKQQPKIHVEPDATDKRLIATGWVLVALNFIVVLSFFFTLPETIPTHFNLIGEADAYGSKNDIWAMPIFNLIMYFGMTMIATKMKPWNYNYPVKVTAENAPMLYARSIRMLAWINLGIASIFLIISTHTILLAKDIARINIGWLILFLVTAITIGPFVYMFKISKSSKP